MNAQPLIYGALGLALVMFFTWALEMHRTLREVLEELRAVRKELEDRERYRR